MSIETLRGEIARTARELPVRGLVTATVGNVSARCRAGMLITPTRRAYRDLRAADVVRLTLDGDPVERAGGEPSLEWPLHAAIYRARPDVGAVVHTHSPYATARSFDPTPLVVQTEERAYLGLEAIAVAAEAPAGSAQLPAAALEALGDRAAVLLARHGVVAVGETPGEALELCWTVEHQALIEYLVARAATPAVG